MEITVIYEDAELLIINKPAGIVVNRADSVSVPTVQDWLEQRWGAARPSFPENWRECLPTDFTEQYGTPEEIFLQRSGIAHRLDKETSGILVIAKHPGSLIALLAQFRDRVVQKQYLCLVHGILPSKSGTIDAPLGRRSGNRKLFGVVAGGRQAVTDYQVLREYGDFDVSAFEKLLQATGQGKQKRISLYTGFSLVLCAPKTGRTHQIRVHMAHIQHPIVGDKAYVGKKRAKIDALWCVRHFLHAARLTLIHPAANRETSFDAPLPQDLTQALGYALNPQVISSEYHYT